MGTIIGSVAAHGGVVAPGDDPATLTITGDLIQDAGSTLRFLLGGLEPPPLERTRGQSNLRPEEPRLLRRRLASCWSDVYRMFGRCRNRQPRLRSSTHQLRLR